MWRWRMRWPRPTASSSSPWPNFWSASFSSLNFLVIRSNFKDYFLLMHRIVPISRYASSSSSCLFHEKEDDDSFSVSFNSESRYSMSSASFSSAVLVTCATAGFLGAALGFSLGFSSSGSLSSSSSSSSESSESSEKANA